MEAKEARNKQHTIKYLSDILLHPTSCKTRTKPMKITVTRTTFLEDRTIGKMYVFLHHK